MNNIVLSNSVNTQNYEPVFQKQKRAKTVYIDKTPEEKLNRIYRSQGILGKFFDKIQGTLGVGLSKSKLQKELNKTPADKFDKKLNQYYDQLKREYCKIHNIKLIEIKFNQEYSLKDLI